MSPMGMPAFRTPRIAPTLLSDITGDTTGTGFQLPTDQAQGIVSGTNPAMYDMTEEDKSKLLGHVLMTMGASILATPPSRVKINPFQQLGTAAGAGLKTYAEGSAQANVSAKEKWLMSLKEREMRNKEATELLAKKKAEQELGRPKRIEDMFNKELGTTPDQLIPNENDDLGGHTVIPGKPYTLKDILGAGLKNPDYAHLLPLMMEEKMAIPGEMFKDTDITKQWKGALIDSAVGHLNKGGSLHDLPNEIKKGLDMYVEPRQGGDAYGHWLYDRKLEDSPENYKRFLVDYNTEMGIKRKGEKEEKIPEGVFKEGNKSLTRMFLKDIGIQDINKYTNPLTGEFNHDLIYTIPGFTQQHRDKLEKALELKDQYIQGGTPADTAALKAYKTVMKTEVNPGEGEVKKGEFTSSKGKKFKVKPLQ